TDKFNDREVEVEKLRDKRDDYLKKVEKKEKLSLRGNPKDRLTELKTQIQRVQNSYDQEDAKFRANMEEIGKLEELIKDLKRKEDEGTLKPDPNTLAAFEREKQNAKLAVNEARQRLVDLEALLKAAEAAYPTKKFFYEKEIITKPDFERFMLDLE